MAGNKDAKIATARQLAESGKFVMAISAWQQLLEGTPSSDANIYNTIGDLYLRNKETTTAMDAYSQAARCYLQEGFHLKAIALYKKILKLDPNRADISALLGDLNVVRGLMNNAVADYVSGATTYLKAGKTMHALMLFRKVIKVDPQNTAIRWRVADLCLEEKLTDQAIEEYFRIGQEYQRLGQAEEAARCYERILAIAPGHQEARRHLESPPEPVAMEIEDAMMADVEPVVEQPVAAPPDHLGEATIEFQSDGFEGEAEALTLDVEAPSSDRAAFGPAVLEEVAPAEMPDSPALVGSASAMDDEWQALLEPRGPGITDHGDDEAIHRQYDLGLAYKEMGLLDEAIEEFQAAMRGPTRFVDACAMLAACYREQGRLVAAIAFLTRVLSDGRCVGSGVPYVTYELAVLCEEAGLRDRAGQLYAEIPVIRDAGARRERLQGIEDPMALPASTH